MKTYRLFAVIVVSVVIAVLLATALASFTRVSDSALAEVASPRAGVGAGSSRPSTASKNYLPIIFLNSATAGGAWLLAGNAGTNWMTDFIGTTDNMTLTLRVSNTVAYSIVPAVDQTYGFAPNLIGGSPTNKVSPGLMGATIAGGGAISIPNVISGTGTYATIAGGVANTASDSAATIAGGSSNIASGHAASVGGGFSNTSSNTYTTVGGGVANTANGQVATVAGGYYNTASGDYATAGGGYNNTASGYATFVGGGGGNTASNQFATVGGGYNNIANFIGATVGGGWGNTSSGYVSVVAGGGGSFNGIQFLPNSATDRGATVGGGQGNTASGILATVPGGNQNSATGVASFAGGTFAHAAHDGAFVWGDVTYTPFSSTVANQFLVRASGGITLYTNAAASVGASLYPGSGSWNTLSNKNLKANFADVDSRTILERVNDLPITTWNYTTQDAAIRHIGPTAQDFAAAFKVGENDTTISTVDAQGVALAAIQGLALENKAQAKELAELKERNARELTELKELKTTNEQELKELTELRTRLTALEQNAPSNALTLNALAPWAVVGLVALWAMRRKTTYK